MDPFSNSRTFVPPLPERVETPEGAASNTPPPPPNNPFVPRQTSYSSSARSPTVDYRNRERDTHRSQAAARQNEYFIPKDGIDKEVIAADICRYLGNDARVRTGSYEDPITRTVRQGYFINGYRNLTTAMIADLKADTERWNAERMASPGFRGRAPHVEYGASNTHQSRQYYGPTEAPGNQPSGNPSNASGYPNSSSTYQNPSSNYPNPSPYDSNNPSGYSSSASNDPGYGLNPNASGYTYSRSTQEYPSQPPQIPPGLANVANPTSPAEYGARGEYPAPYGAPATANTSAFYSSQSNSNSSPLQYQPPQGGDPYYNRGPAAIGHEDNQNNGYDTGYQGPQEYPPVPRTAPVANTSHQTTRRRDRDSGHGDPERRDRHFHQSRR